MVFKGLANSGAYLARIGTAKALKSDYAKNKIKQTANKYLNQALDSFINDLSKKISGGNIDYSKWYPMEMYSPQGVYDPNNPLYKGGAVDIHKMIGKLPKPKGGWTPSRYKYRGPYNPLDQQVVYHKNTGEVTKWNVKPYNKVDEIAAYHDVCYDMGKNKGDCDRHMVKSLDQIPYGEMPKWGQTARFLINIKQKLGLGVKQSKSKKRKKPSSEVNWKVKLADELHKPIKRNFTRRRIIVNHIDEIWAADLVEMQKFSKWNKDYRYLLMVIDVFSKYGWIEPLKDKRGESISQAFKTILKEGRKPEFLLTDKDADVKDSRLTYGLDAVKG
ncbi:hypothetical protein AWC38_SpisGene13318 [Stylophora pistillata]|uniref:Integrase catalytic domain-containing protein n=1 Tax=Stylophora pistillata TaxID=50429 RepID=A0A2B4RZF0_STYPI|nr:hypothetical protein AWC38_SpisGene13318 [Stylophora pistillata]